MKKLNKLYQWWLSLAIIKKISDIENNDSKKAIVNLLFNNNTTEESIQLFESVKASFKYEMEQRKKNAIEEHKVISTFFRENLD